MLPLTLRLRRGNIRGPYRDALLPAVQYRIGGITKDAAGNALPACTVKLYQTGNDLEIDRTVSDANGNYSFSTLGPAENYYCVAYLAGSPDRAGTTVNTLTGAG